jgi:hypothetical protein
MAVSTIEYMRKWRAENKEKNQAYHEAYRNRHRAKINKRVREWKRAHRDNKRREQGREAYYRHHEQRLQCAKDWRKRHPEYQKKMNAKYINELADCYVIASITQGKGLRSQDIPVELVEVKREVLKLRRKVNEKQCN